MGTRERLWLMLGVWLTLYPSVTVLTYLTEPLEWPLFVETLVTTCLTVPMITFLVVPGVKKLIAKAEDKPEIAED